MRGIFILLARLLTTRIVIITLVLASLGLVIAILLNVGGVVPIRWSTINACGVGFLYHISTSLEVPYFTYSVIKNSTMCILKIVFAGSFTVRDLAGEVCIRHGQTILVIDKRTVIVLDRGQCIIMNCPSSSTCELICNTGTYCTVTFTPFTVPVAWKLNNVSS